MKQDYKRPYTKEEVEEMQKKVDADLKRDQPDHSKFTSKDFDKTIRQIVKVSPKKKNP